MAWIFLKLYKVVFSFFAGAALALLFYQLLDLLITSVVFLWTGEFNSVYQKALPLGISVATVFSEDTWQLHTGLKGFDWLANSFMALQYSTSGRWMMLGIAGLISVLMGFFSPDGYSGIFKDTETKRTGWIDEGSGFAIAIVTILAPISWAPQVGVTVWFMSWFEENWNLVIS